ncbi:glycine zipper 2TM domain-containing protein [Massilia aerilata]|uniref:Glycine zipper 2TM domain-containing protein n=1 Tax=Massilia aerilata TaxID=453817 RepID=A0ABW0S4K3_9BURK
MKKALSLVFFFAVAAAATFGANAAEVMATITNVSPVYSERVQNQQVCDMVYNDQAQQAGAVNPGSVIGGIAGALLGSQVGGGNGKVAMAALGAVTGAISGDRIAQQQRSNPQQNCRVVQRMEQQISGYRVTYQYLQETFQSFLSYDPSRGGAVTTVPAQMSLSLR